MCNIYDITITANLSSAYTMKYKIYDVFSAGPSMDAITTLGLAALNDVDKLIEWVRNTNIDPNDPANSELMFLLRVS